MAYHYLFKNDYSEGCHPCILQALQDTNSVQQAGYGSDEYSEEAKTIIRKQLADPHADIHFVSGGTQANLVIISSALRPYEAVISAHSGHINVHETGAIEAAGHKIESIQAPDGKLTPHRIAPVMQQMNDIHMVQPKMVYISNVTESGTLYTKGELEDLSAYCRENDLYLFLDGARLPAALRARGNDLTLADISGLVDVFYIGGTKNGGLFGEAVIISHEALKTGFSYHLKQKGALLAKGRALGIQFRELFREGLIFELAEKANSLALDMADTISQLGYSFLTDPCSNQLFPILPNEIINELKKRYGFYVWQKVDDHHAAVRLVTSWATPKEACEAFVSDLKRLNAVGEPTKSTS